jgi:HNH endonuclease
MILTGHETVAHLCELSTGVVIAPNLIVPYLSGAQVQGVVFADSRDIKSMSPQRTFTGWLRRAIQIRDRHCQHPAGCDEPIAQCDVDHILPDAQGGQTTYENGRLQCTTHNRDPKLHDRAPPSA